jgi:hypothetical protein
VCNLVVANYNSKTNKTKKVREKKKIKIKKETKEINRVRWWTNKQGTKQMNKQTHKKKIPGSGTIEFQSGVTPSAFSPGSSI